jgi:cytochrome c-type biogenesis protein CcmE
MTQRTGIALALAFIAIVAGLLVGWLRSGHQGIGVTPKALTSAATECSQEMRAGALVSPRVALTQPPGTGLIGTADVTDEAGAVHQDLDGDLSYYLVGADPRELHHVEVKGGQWTSDLE